MTDTEYKRIMKEVKAEFKEWLRDKRKDAKAVKAEGEKIRQATLKSRKKAKRR